MRRKQCLNLSRGDNNAASSVNTLGNCIRLYSGSDCIGKSYAFYPGSPSHDNLPKLQFNDIASSIGRCYDDDFCDARVKRSTSSQANCRFANDLVTVGFREDLLQDQTDLHGGPIVYYQIGPLTRTEVMEAHILPQHLNTGTSIDANAQDYVRQMGNSNDDAGLILASKLGGLGNDTRNIFPQSSNVNHIVWDQVESSVADIVQKYGGAHFTINLLYHSVSNTRPYEIIYRIKSLFSNKVLKINDLINP